MLIRFGGIRGVSLEDVEKVTQGRAVQIEEHPQKSPFMEIWGVDGRKVDLVYEALTSQLKLSVSIDRIVPHRL